MSQIAHYMPLAEQRDTGNRRDRQMAGYNTSFELTVNDIERIEAALRLHKQAVSLERLELMEANGTSSDAARTERVDAELAAIHDLLGRLHNQKIFYRPTNTDKAPYVGG